MGIILMTLGVLMTLILTRPEIQTKLSNLLASEESNPTNESTEPQEVIADPEVTENQDAITPQETAMTQEAVEDQEVTATQEVEETQVVKDTQDAMAAQEVRADQEITKAEEAAKAQEAAPPEPVDVSTITSAEIYLKDLTIIGATGLGILISEKVKAGSEQKIYKKGDFIEPTATIRYMGIKNGRLIFKAHDTFIYQRF